MTDEAQKIHDEIIAHLRLDNDRLHRELPEMREQNRRLTAFFQDAAAFLRSKLWNRHIVLETLTHDITGLAEDQPCFVPRVSGYAKREREIHNQLAQSETK